jgi:hypothetical protein
MRNASPLTGFIMVLQGIGGAIDPLAANLSLAVVGVVVLVAAERVQPS